MIDVAAGLLALEEKKSVHLDLKSNNLLITGDRKIKISDLGLGKLIHGVETVTSQIGTPMWMAPEVRHGVCGLASDIYSFGTILYEVIIFYYFSADSLFLMIALHMAS